MGIGRGIEIDSNWEFQMTRVDRVQVFSIATDDIRALGATLPVVKRSCPHSQSFKVDQAISEHNREEPIPDQHHQQISK